MKIYKVKVNGKLYEVELESVSEKDGAISAPQKEETPAKAAPAVAPVSAGSGTPLKAPLQGTILDVKVKVGDKVKKGQAVVILEAMKLENEVVAPEDGVITEVKVSKGQTVNNQEVLLVIGK